MDKNEPTFKDFEIYFNNFEAEDVINLYTQQFKQALIDKSNGNKLDMQNPANVQFVFSEFFKNAMMSNIQVLKIYHYWLTKNYDIISKDLTLVHEE